MVGEEPGVVSHIQCSTMAMRILRRHAGTPWNREMFRMLRRPLSYMLPVIGVSRHLTYEGQGQHADR